MADQLHTDDLASTSSTQMITVTLTPDGDFNLQHEHEEPQLMEVPHQHQMTNDVKHPSRDPLAVLPQIPFSFPGQTFDTKCQKLILNVWDFFKRVKKNPDIMEEIRTPQERAAAALHISAATIGKIGKNFKKTGKLETPGSSRKRCRPVVDSVSAEDEDMIRDIITEMRSQKNTPTLPSVLAEARIRINYTGGATSFRRILARMGFKNLSQKGTVVKTSHIPEDTPMPSSTGGGMTINQSPGVTFTTSSGISFSPNLKVVKKELSSTATTNSIDQQQNSTTSPSTSNTNSGTHIIQLPAGQILAQTEGGGATFINAGGGSLQSGHTIYIQGADNTIRPVQLIFSPSNLNLQQQ